MIGKYGFLASLAYLLAPDPFRQGLRPLAFSYLYLSVFVCEGRRSPPIRYHIVTHFHGLGVALPIELLELIYAWGSASKITDSYFLKHSVNSPDHFPVLIRLMVITWEF